MLKMNVSSIKTDDYVKNPDFTKNRNKAKTKPIRRRLRLCRDGFKANPASPLASPRQVQSQF